MDSDELAKKRISISYIRKCESSLESSAAPISPGSGPTRKRLTPDGDTENNEKAKSNSAPSGGGRARRIEGRPVAAQQYVSDFKRALAPYKHHFLDENFAILWLSRNADCSKPTILIPKHFRYPPINSLKYTRLPDDRGCGGYTEVMHAISMWRTQQAMDKNNFHIWHYPENFNVEAFAQAVRELKHEVTLSNAEHIIKVKREHSSEEYNSHHAYESHALRGDRAITVIDVGVQTEEYFARILTEDSSKTTGALCRLIRSTQAALNVSLELLKSAEAEHQREIAARDQLRAAIAEAPRLQAAKSAELERELSEAKAAAEKANVLFQDRLERVHHAMDAARRNDATLSWEDLNASVGKAFLECQKLESELCASKKKVAEIEQRIDNLSSEQWEQASISEERIRSRRAELAAAHVEQVLACVQHRRAAYACVAQHGEAIFEVLSALTTLPKSSIDSVPLSTTQLREESADQEKDAVSADAVVDVEDA